MLFFLMIGAVSAQEDTNVTVSEMPNTIEYDYTCEINEEVSQMQDNSEINKTSQAQSEVFKAPSNGAGSFSDLKNLIDSSSDNKVLDLNCNYQFDESTDSSSVITITHNNFTINGNGNKIDACGKINIFKTEGVNITIKNLTFTNAYTSTTATSFGGAITNSGDGLLLINSTFISNDVRNGAAIYNSAAKNVSVVNCNFINNSATYSGGCIFNNMGDYFSVENCTFINSTIKKNDSGSQIGGSAIYIWGGSTYLGGNYFSVVNSRFINNSAPYGVIYNQKTKNLTVVNCSFINNKDNTFGRGVIHNGLSLGLSVINSSFINNSAKVGTAIFDDTNAGNCSILNCTFIGNKVLSEKGVIRSYSSKGCTSIINSTFINNTAKNGGAAIDSGSNNMYIANCSFINNGGSAKSDVYSGAIFNNMANFTVLNSSFVNNYAILGGAIYNKGANASITGSTFVNNTATQKGNAIYSTVAMTANDNWWGNNTPNWSKLIYNQKGTTTHDTYAVLNLTANLNEGSNECTVYLKFYNNGTSNLINVYPRDVKLTIGDDVIEDTIPNNVFEYPFTSPSSKYDIIAVVDNQKLNVTFNTKSSPDLKVDIKEITYGDDLVIDAIITPITSGNVTICVDTKNYTANITNEGKIHYTVSNLSAGIHNVTVKYGGDDTYDVAENSTLINVAQAKANLEVSIANVTYGKASSISVNLTGVNNTKLSGTVVVTIGEKGYNVEVKNGVGSSDEVKLPVNTYEFSASWEDNANYTKAVVPGKFNVSKAKLDIDVKLKSIEVGQNATITVTGLADATGNITIKVNDTSYSVKIKNGMATKNVTDLKAGNYTVNVTYPGDDNYNSTSGSNNLIVAKLNPGMTVDVNNTIKFGENLTIAIDLPTNATGNLTITIDNKATIINVTNKIIIPNLNAGNHNITVKYNGNDIYAESSKITNINVTKINATLNVDISDVYYNEIPNIVASIIGLNNTQLNGNVTITINGKPYNLEIKDGACIYDSIILPVNTYEFNATWEGNTNYNMATTDGTFNIFKNNSTIKVEVDPVEVGKNTTIVVTLSENATGNVTINGEIVEIKNAIATKNITFSKAGNYTITVVYNGDDNYNNASGSANLPVFKVSNYNMTVNATNVTVGQNATVSIDLPIDVNENVTIAIDGKNYTAEVKNGIGSVNVSDLGAGEHEVIVNFENDKYAFNSANTTFNISKVSDYNMTVGVANVTVGQNATVSISLPIDVNENVTIAIDGENYTVEVKNGVGSVNVSDLGAGEHEVIVNFENDKYAFNSANTTFNISKISDYDVNVTIPEAKEGSNSTIIVNLPKDATGNVTVTINGKNYSATIKDGIANVEISPMNAGTYNITTTYSGDNKYSQITKPGNITVISDKVGVNLTTKDVVMIYKDGSRLIANLLDTKGNPIANATILFIIHGINYTKTTNENGTAYLTINLDPGFYNVTVFYLGNTTNATVNATVKVNSSIEGNDVIKMYQNGTQFYATFYGANGDVLANANVKFNINGVFYERKTNENGTAKLNINLNPGNYTLTTYNNVTGEEKGFNVMVEPLIITSDLTKYYMNASKFEAKVYNKDGSLAINKTITFNINGVFYKRTTDENGIVKLAITLRPGNYTITTLYDGLSVGNNVNVLPTLETGDLSMKYNDGSVFSAKTLDDKGNPLANQNITYNVNGVFYHKTTGSDGIANLNINLQKGNYIITSYWRDYEIGNKLVVA